MTHVPSAVLLARFRRHYPADVWRADAYRTDDGIIPFGLFWIYYRAMESTQALERVSFTRAVAAAVGLCFAGKGAALPATLTSDLRDAFLDG